MARRLQGEETAVGVPRSSTVEGARWMAKLDQKWFLKLVESYFLVK
jgi:hypothetical protein